MTIEIILKGADTSTTAGPLVPSMIALDRIQRIGKEPSTGRATVFLISPSSVVGGGVGSLPTYETYDAVAARMALMTSSAPNQRVGSADASAASSARTAYAASTGLSAS